MTLTFSTTRILLLLVFFGISFFITPTVFGVGTRQIGEACNSTLTCIEGLSCDDGFCTCSDISSPSSNHCQARYGGTADGWKCVDEDEDPVSERGEWNFCKKTTYRSSLPRNSTEDVKYPVETKILMGYPCDDTHSCLSDNGQIGDMCNETSLASSPNTSDPYFDPWYTPGRKLNVCAVPRNLSAPTICKNQYGGDGWGWVDGSGELVGIATCGKQNSPPFMTLQDMQKSVTQDSEDNPSDTTIFGFDATLPEMKLVKPTPKIGIPGVVFSNISKESSITTDAGGTSWLNIPFLGEYISAIYRYSVGLISLIAVLVLLVSGVQIATSAGNSEVISGAKQRIVSSIIAITLTAGSYTILYTINPELVNLKNLKIQVILGTDLKDVVDASFHATTLSSTGEFGESPQVAQVGPNVDTDATNCTAEKSVSSGIGKDTFLGQLDCVSKQKRKALTDVKFIILHDGGRTAAGTLNYWKKNCTNKGQCVSSHYFIERDGTIYQLLDEKKVAYHTPGWNDASIGIDLAITDSPADRSTQSCLQCKKSGKCTTYTGKPAEGSISNKQTAIEECSKGFEDAQYNSLKILIESIVSRTGVTKNGESIRAHCNTAKNHGDPVGFDWSKIGITQTNTQGCYFEPNYSQKIQTDANRIFGQ
jgi:N-acetyl-anhydromuramyl-L-alanine amidase AmpD